MEMVKIAPPLPFGARSVQAVEAITRSVQSLVSHLIISWSPLFLSLVVVVF